MFYINDKKIKKYEFGVSLVAIKLKIELRKKRLVYKKKGSLCKDLK